MDLTAVSGSEYLKTHEHLLTSNLHLCCPCMLDGRTTSSMPARLSCAIWDPVEDVRVAFELVFQVHRHVVPAPRDDH